MRRWIDKAAMLGLGLTLVAGCKSVPPPKPLTELSAQETHGRAIFETHCAACHYDRKNGALHGPSLLGTFKKEYLPSGAPANDDRVLATILHGRNMMPAMGNTMDPQERADLMAYLHTL